jgi:hypothetical protein
VAVMPDLLFVARLRLSLELTSLVARLCCHVNFHLQAFTLPLLFLEAS